MLQLTYPVVGQLRGRFQMVSWNPGRFKPAIHGDSLLINMPELASLRSVSVFPILPVLPVIMCQISSLKSDLDLLLEIVSLDRGRCGVWA